MSKSLLWIDLEMTGLDEKTDSILELAAVITTIDLKPIEEYHRVVFQPEAVLNGMNDWCKKTHGESGLTAAVPTGAPLATVEKEMLALLGKHFATSDRIVLAGNSVGNDRRFIDAYMPELSKRLHYRLIDVSSFKEIFRERYGVHVNKGNAHRAVDDIHESIRELAHYLSFVQVPPKPGTKPGEAKS